MTPQQFSAKWADNELKESAASEEHFLDVCALVGAPTHMGFGNDPRYNSARTFKTFPFPWPPGTEPAEDDPRVAAIAEAAREIDRLRGGWLSPEGCAPEDLEGRTLTSLYNARPTWLANAHAVLDRAVYAAYRWEEDPEQISEEELLKRLLGLNALRAAEADAG